jgi:hypothetical protein
MSSPRRSNADSRRVVAFLSANQTAPGVACKLSSATRRGRRLAADRGPLPSDRSRAQQRKHVARHASDDRLESHVAADDPFENAAKRDDAQRLQASITMLLDAQAEVSTLAYYGVPSGQRLHRRALNEQLGPAG